MTSVLFEIWRIVQPRFKCNDLENQKLFLIVLFSFWNLHQISKILKRNIIVIATLLRKLQPVKDFVRPVSKKQSFTTPFDSQHVKWCKTFLKSA